MSDRLTDAVDRLGRIPGVRGALLVDAEAGLPIVGELPDDTAAPAAAALAAAAYRRTGRAVGGNFGRLGAFRLEAASGQVLITGTGGLLVVVIAEPGTPLGLVQLEARQVAEALS